ncbi:nucleotide exchange factor GrpE [Geofilum sp. OHC36d9]|uniref:nucleotide exchange factor GrpE n=1 Tax=Geofilum sp. OHC36d9 TaxID=3458413 RepID=UPI004034CCE7
MSNKKSSSKNKEKLKKEVEADSVENSSENIPHNEVIDDSSESAEPSKSKSNDSSKSKGTAESKESKEAPQMETPAESEVEILERKLAELNDKHVRLIAEYDNYRKRTLKEKMELTRLAGEKIFLNILPVVDDFERAIQHLDTASDLNAVKEGINLIYSKFITFLNQNGVKEVETKEQDFDLDLHEAITKIPAPAEDLKGKIIDCVQKGYMLDDKVIRFPKVVVGE